ncbi:autophagy protein 13 [Mortierella sp. GBA30]|nr:autophagy protein 13 [Mortierella sp. GBA30]
MSRHSSNSSYYQPSSRPESPAQLSSSSSSNPQQQQQRQQSPIPQQPPPPPRNQRADQILQNFYVKVIQIVVLARVTHTDPHAGHAPKKGSLRGAPLLKKTSKWFNLELEDLDIYREDAKFWRAIAITDSPPTMLVELLLDTSELSPSQMLVLMDENNRKNRVDISSSSSTSTTPLGQAKTRRSIILESWSLSLSNTLPDPVPEPPVVYKKSIIFFRSLFAYMRLLPAYQLYRRLRKQNHPLKIGFRVNRGQTPEESMYRDSEIGIEVPLIDGETRAMLSEYRFGQVETPLGAFSLKVTYRSNCGFHVDESEAVLSSRFIDMDENYFTPTIVTHSQESVRSMRRPSIEGNMARRPPSGTPLARRSSNASNDMYNSGQYQEHFTPAQTLRPRRNSAQSLQQRSGDYSSSQSSVSSLGTRMSRRGSSGAPGGQFTPLDQQNSAGTPPFSVAHGGHAAVAKHYVDPIMESPPFKLGTSQADKDSRRPLSSNFSPFKSPSLSSSPSPSFLEALPPSLSSRPSSIHLNRSPSSSSMSRVQSSQLGSGLLGSTPKTGSLATNIAGASSSSVQSAGANLLSTSAKSNASSTSAPRVTSSFGHRQDSSGRRASSESLPPGRGSRNSIIGSSSLFQLTPDDDDVNAFVRMLDTPEPLKMFGKVSGSGLGPSFGSSDNSSQLSASAIRTRATLDHFQQLKQINADLSDSMSASQIMSREQQQQTGIDPPLMVSTSGHAHRRSNLSDMEPSSPTGLPFGTTIPTSSTTVNRHSQSLSHQPGTPSPLHSEIPVYPATSSDRSGASPMTGRQSSSQPAVGSRSPNKRHSWLIGEGANNSGPFTSGGGGSGSRTGSNMGNIAFRHGSLDQGKDILGMEEALGRLRVTGRPPHDDIAYGSFPEDVHHQHSLYSAPLNTGGVGDKLLESTAVTSTSGSDATGNGRAGTISSFASQSTFGPDPRPIPSLTSGGSSSSRPGRILRLGSGSSGASFTLPRLRPRAAEDNDSLNEMNSADDSGTRHDREGDRHRRRRRQDEEEEDDEEEDEESRDLLHGSGRRDKHDGHNTSINDDDDMLFIMSELSPGSTSGQESTTIGGALAAGGGLSERVMLSLTGAIPKPRSQSQSPALGPLGNGSSAGGSSASSSPHMRLFGRGNSGINTNAGNSGGGSNIISVMNLNMMGNQPGNVNNASNSNSRTHSVSHSRGGSNSGGSDSVENLTGTLRRSVSASGSMSGSGPGSGVVDEFNLPSATTTPPPQSPAAQNTTNNTGRRMSRGGSDRGGMGSSGGGANSDGHNSFHSDSRGGARIEGW